MQPAGNEFLVMMVLVFVTVILLIESAYMFWQTRHGPARRLLRRLRVVAGEEEISAETAHLLKERLGSEGSILQRIAKGAAWGRTLERLLQQAGLPWTVGRLLLLCIVFAAFTLVVVLVAFPAYREALILPFVAGAVPMAYVLRCRNIRLRALERQLPEALDLMVRGLRAGHALSSTLKMAGDELPEPVGGEFRVLHDEINFGVSLQQALTNLTERVPSTDVRYFVVSVLIQRESGGNLTEILGNLSRLIRERLKLLARVRVLSSEGRLSAWILVFMPFAIAAVMTSTNYKFMSRMWTDPLGITITKIMLVLMLIGVLMLRKIVRIRV